MSEANNPAPEDTGTQELAPEVETEGAESHTETETGEADTSEGEGEPSEDDEDHEELELDGVKYLTPKQLKKAFEEGTLRQSDYTRKTQEVAQQRQALDNERQQLEEERAHHAESLTTLRAEHGRIATLETQLAEYKDVDWGALRNQIAAMPDPAAQAQAIAQYNLAWNSFTGLERDLGQAKTTLTTKEQELKAAQTQRVQAAVRDALQSLQKEDTTLTADKVNGAVKHAMDNFGLTESEARQLGDKRIWKLMLSDKTKTDELAALKAENAKLKGQRSAETANKAAQQARPAIRVAGAKAPTTGISDNDPHDVWLKKREAQIARRQRA